MPIPDVTLLKPRSDFYTEVHPKASDVLLVVEVSHTTVRYDSKPKSSLYADAGIAEYWQLDVTKETLIIRTVPRDSEYRNVDILHRGETVRLYNLPEFAFSTDEIIG